MRQDPEEEKVDEELSQKQTSETVPKPKKSGDQKNPKETNTTDESCTKTTTNIEGDVTETSKIARGSESAFFTNISDTNSASLSSMQADNYRLGIEQLLSEWTYVPSVEEAVAAWNVLSCLTDASARDLSEKLRLILEPMQASRLKGDYRSGRRINMRKIIPYIASQFRKDKIWLRRTKPSKRDYQIILAIDDSSSMADNHSKELAFESLSLISKAITYLEAGQLAVISFGEEINFLHPLGEPFTERSGSRYFYS